MTCTAEIIKNRIDSNGRRRVFVEYTHVETGEKIWGGVILVDVGANAQALVDSKCAKVDRNLRRSECEAAAKKVLTQGRVPPSPKYVGGPQLQKFLCRRIWNAVARKRRLREVEDVLQNVVNAKSFLDSVPDGRLRAVLGLSMSEVTQFRADIQALVDADGNFAWAKARSGLDEEEA